VGAGYTLVHEIQHTGLEFFKVRFAAIHTPCKRMLVDHGIWVSVCQLDDWNFSSPIQDVNTLQLAENET